MPELPEVETVRRQLTPHLIDQTITGVEVFHAKTVAHDSTIEDRLVGKTIHTIERIGKLLIISFYDTDDLFLLIHLKMTGQLLYQPTHDSMVAGGHTLTANDSQDLPNRHSRSAFSFTDGSTLYFNDMRLFGYTKLATKAQVATARAGFGPEPTDPNFDIDWFVAKLRTKRTTVKAALLNQAFVSGLGNIYVDEALFRAGVRPTRNTARINKTEAHLIGEAAGAVMQEAITVGGTTFQHFVDTGGQAGNFTDYLRVFGRQGSPCLVCGTTIKKIRTAGRGTHFCPQCQT